MKIMCSCKIRCFYTGKQVIYIRHIEDDTWEMWTENYSFFMLQTKMQSILDEMCKAYLTNDAKHTILKMQSLLYKI